jgi:hypothetical protein
MSAGSSGPCPSWSNLPLMANPIQPDRSEPTETARQNRPMGTHRPRKAGPFVRSAVNDLRTADQADDRTSIRPNRTTRTPALRLDRRVEPTRQKRTSEPHHQQKRRPVPPSLLLPGHSATTHRPRQEYEATQQGHLRQRLVPTERQCAGSAKARTASNPTAAPRPTSIRSSVVPAERHRVVQAARTCSPIRSSHHVPSERSTVRSSRTPILSSFVHARRVLAFFEPLSTYAKP